MKALVAESTRAVQNDHVARRTHYSHRSATTGSTREAATAGRVHAAIAVAATPTHATANEAPSVGWMSYKRLLSTRLVPSAETAPARLPIRDPRCAGRRRSRRSGQGSRVRDPVRSEATGADLSGSRQGSIDAQALR